MSKRTLRDVLPTEALSYTEDKFYKFLDVEVWDEYCLGNDERAWVSWPGKHKNVMCWWKLANGKAVGWNENPSIGWSFPVITWRKQKCSTKH